MTFIKDHNREIGVTKMCMRRWKRRCTLNVIILYMDKRRALDVAFIEYKMKDSYLRWFSQG